MLNNLKRFVHHPWKSCDNYENTYYKEFTGDLRKLWIQDNSLTSTHIWLLINEAGEDEDCAVSFPLDKAACEDLIRILQEFSKDCP